MLDKLQKQGWTVERDDDDTVAIYACFDDGFWSYVYIWTNVTFRKHISQNIDMPVYNADTVGEQAYIVTSVTLHRLTDSQEVVNETSDEYDGALNSAYATCQEIRKRFKRFCPD